MLVAAVIDGVDEGFLRGFMRIVEDPLGFGLARNSRHALLDDAVAKIGQSIAQLLIEWPAEDFLFELVAAHI